MQLTPPPELVNTAPARPGIATMLLIAIALLAPFLLYFSTAKSIIDIWNSSETFAHGYIILPMCLWLIWRRRVNFSTLPPTPYWPALALLALAGLAWLVARMGEVQVVQQYALVAMLPLIALAVFGRRLAQSLAFPLLFVLAAVPFGEIFIAPLISFTADFTVWALQLTGIPVLRNGTYFEIPTGHWSVVEACSGVRYLISSVTLGLLYAYLTYRSNARRALFMVMAVIVPIIANGLRAYMIVMIGHLSGMKLAVGVDHLIYGWLFFGLVMFAMFWIGSFWREDEQPAPLAPAAAPAAVSRSGAAALAPMVAAVLAVVALWPAFAAFNQRSTTNPHPVNLAPLGVRWAAAPAFTPWSPDFMRADATFTGVYRDAGEPVALTLLYYRNQTRNKALISSQNNLTGEHNPLHQIRSSLRTEQLGARTFTLRESNLQGPSGPLLVWHWTWVDNRVVNNDYVAKLWQAQAKLAFRADDGAAVILAAPLGEHPEQARQALHAFLAAHLNGIEAALAATRER